MDKKLTVSAKDDKVLFPVAVRGLKTPVLKLSIIHSNTHHSGSAHMHSDLK